MDLHRSGRFIEQQFGIEAGEETVRRYLVQNGFSSHKGRRRTAGYRLDLEVLIDLYMEDVQRFWELGLKDMSPQHIACIDSSAIGWRLLTRKTYLSEFRPTATPWRDRRVGTCWKLKSRVGEREGSPG